MTHKIYLLKQFSASEQRADMAVAASLDRWFLLSCPGIPHAALKVVNVTTLITVPTVMTIMTLGITTRKLVLPTQPIMFEIFA